VSKSSTISDTVTKISITSRNTVNFNCSIFSTTAKSDQMMSYIAQL